MPDKEPQTAEEFDAALKAIADIPAGEMTDDDLAKYEALESKALLFAKANNVKGKYAAWSRPRVTVLPAAPKGDAGEMYAWDGPRGYLRTGQYNMDMAGRENNGLPVQSYDLTETTTAGGYLVPTTLEQKIVLFKKNYGGIASVADTLDTGTMGNPVNYPTNDDTANTAEIDAINTAMSSAGADITFGQVPLGAYSYMAGGTSNKALNVPFELAADVRFPITNFVSERLGIRLGRKMGHDLAIGTGSSQPKGLFDRIPDINLLSGNFTQTAAVNYGQLVGAVAVAGGGQGTMFTLDPDYLPNATWVMRYSTLGILASITDTTGRPIFQPFAQSEWGGGGSNMAADGTATDGQGYRPRGLLIGFPVVVDQDSPAVANASIAKPGAALDAFISFGDHRQAYVVRPIQGTTILVDPITGMSKRQIGYWAWARQDATIQNAKAHVLLAGWNAA
jgi:HK97 family phage major capsid protein